MGPRVPTRALAAVLDERTAALPAAEMAEALETQLAGLGEAQRASFDKALATIGTTALQAAPGALAGAGAGAAAGPYGALVGGLLGGVASVAAAHAPGHTAPTAPAATTAPAAPVAPAATAPVAGANAAAADLLTLLQDPRLLQAAAALVAGSLGRAQLTVGGAAAPPAALLNALAVLALQAAAQAPLAAESVDEYLLDDEGRPACDVVDPAARARLLLERCRQDRAAGAGNAPGQWLLETGLAELGA